MIVQWFSKGMRGWQEAGIDWLCLRLEPGADFDRVDFEEGRHHHFDEMLLLKTAAFAERQPVGGLRHYQSLAAPDPVSVSSARLEEHEADAILLRVRFCPANRPPFARGAESKEIRCGTVYRTDGSFEPIIMQWVENARPGSSPAAPARWREAAEVLVTSAGDITGPHLKKLPGSTALRFQLVRPAVKDVLVFVLEREPARMMALGEEIDLAEYDDSIERVTILRGTHAPSTTVQSRTGVLAVPVLRLNSSQGIVGRALVLRPPIKGLELEKVEDAMLVKWSWGGPAPWISVDLQWEIVDPDGVSQEKGHRVVTATQYKHKRNREVARLSDWPDSYAVYLVATPVIQEVLLPEHVQKTDLCF